MQNAQEMMVPPSYGVGSSTEDNSEVPLLRVERLIRRQVQATSPVLVVPDVPAAGESPFGGARRLMTHAEAPEMFGLAREMSSHYQQLEQERTKLDEQIQLLIERRMRVDTNLSLMRQSLTAYAKVMDLEDILPSSISE